MLGTKTRFRTLPVFGMVIAIVAMLAPAATAAPPPPPYERFAGCPTQEEVPHVIGCVFSEVKGGHVQMGSKTVPISKPLTMTGGVGSGLSDFVYNSEGGLERVPLEVPGGLIGITGLDWLVNYLNAEQLKLYAVTELAGTPVLGTTTIQLPVKVQLVNEAIGDNCYIGSDANPIVMNLTIGTTNPPPPNEPISGETFEFSVDPETEILSLKNGVYVDNAFAAPAASGCKLTLLGLETLNIDSLVNFQAGLPSPAGTNETIQEIDTEVAPVDLVYP